MELNREAVNHWVDVFKRVIADGPNEDITPLLTRLDLYVEHLEEEELDESEEGVFDWGQGNASGTLDG